MILTTAQIEAIKHGEPVTVEANEIGTDCVVLRADVYARVKRLIHEGNVRRVIVQHEGRTVASRGVLA